MNIKTKLTLVIGLLVMMTFALVVVSVINVQILTATDPQSPAAGPGMERALLWITMLGAICIFTGIGIWISFPSSIVRPIKELLNAIQDIASQHYERRLQLYGTKEFDDVSHNFNIMAERLAAYHESSISQLIAAKKYMETLVNSITEPIITLDNNKNIIFINDAALSILNISRNNAIGHSANQLSISNDLLRQLIRDLDKTESNIDNSASQNKQANETPLKIYSDEKESYFQVKYITIVNKKNNSEKDEKSHMIMLKNVTEFKERDSAKTTFISTISHELKTPIAAIMMSLKLLEDSRIGMLNNEQVELTDDIKQNSERLLSITSELLNMTQVESGKLQLKPRITRPIELIDYAIKANRVQAEKFNISIEVEYPKDNNISKLFVDSEKIAWVLTNLLSNAIRYSQENARVIIGAAQQDKSHVQIYVRDFGKGIDPRYHHSIFDHYFRVPGTKVQGSGLGLSISKDFVEAHGGTLTVDSQIGSGSTFTVTLEV